MQRSTASQFSISYQCAHNSKFQTSTKRQNQCFHHSTLISGTEPEKRKISKNGRFLEGGSIYIYGVVSRVNGPPPHGMGGGVGTRIRYTHCISTLCRLSTLPQYYKPPPHHRGGGESYTLPQYRKPPPHHRGGGESFTTTPHGGGGGGGPANTAPYIQ